MHEEPILIHGPAEKWEKLLSIASRIFVWGLLFAALYILRSFFLLIFLTFVFAYIQANGVERLAQILPNRSLRVVIVALALLGIIVSIGAYLTPRVRQEAALFADRYPEYLQTFDRGLFQLTNEYPVLQSALHSTDTSANTNWDPQHSPSATLVQGLLGFEGEANDSQAIKQTIQALRNVSAYLVSVASAFLLSLLFSFLIVLDLPALIHSTRNLRTTKLAFIYDEVAENIMTFGKTLGRALEAQLLIALLNTVLTGLGLALLGLSQKMSFLLVIVFFCSFIPVAGVFISSVPISLVALQESGLKLMFLCVGMITIVHMIEAYVLNPKIYGHHMRMNPVIVLIILTIAGKLFHVWGLVLGVPVCTYIFGHAIRRLPETTEE